MTIGTEPGLGVSPGATSSAGNAGDTVREQRDAVLRDAPAAIERSTWDRVRIRHHQQHRLRTLLAHAATHSPFHAARLATVDASTFELADLATLPTMTKTEMMRHFDDVVTDRRITRGVVDDHLAAAGPAVSYLFDEYVVMASGGSSGERGVFVYGMDAATEFVLTIVRPTLAKLAALGVTPANPVPGALVAAGTSLHGTAFVAAVAGDGGPVKLTSIPATLPFDAIVRRLEEVRPVLLVGYPTMLARLAFERAAGHLSITPLAVSSTSELLTAPARRAIEDGFGVPVADTFGSTEGLCGVAPPGEPAICFAEDTCIVELVDDAGRPVQPGETSAKVLVTNLANLTQPLIRYELTDRFTELAGPWPDGHLRAVVEGRNDAVVTIGGVDVHPLAIRSVLVKVAQITEYQVHHDADGLRLLVVAPGGVDVERVGHAVADALRGAGVADPRVEVIVVERIERDPITGKARRFVDAR